MSQRRLSQAVNTILWKEQQKSDLKIQHTIHIFPHKDFISGFLKQIAENKNKWICVKL